MILKIFRKYNINLKILVPLLALMTVLFVCILVGIIYFLNNTYNKQTEKIVENKIAEFNRTTDEIGNIALYFATLISNSEVVQEAYDEYNKSGNTDKAAQILSTKFSGLNKKFSKFTDSELKIHFHAPPAKSIFRSWTDIKGDDLSKFRNSVNLISKTHKIQKGIETGRAGFVIRGIAPVYSKQGKYEGSAEAIFDINYLAKEKYNKYKDNFAILLNDKMIDIAKIFIDKNQSNVSVKDKKIGNYILIEKTPNFDDKNINAETLKTNKNKKKLFWLKDKYEYAVIPVKSITGNEEGIILLQIDIKKYKNDLKNVLTLFTSIFFLFIILIIFILNTISKHYIANRIKQTDNYLLNLSKGKLIKHADIKYNDEISNMQNSLIELSNSLQEKINFAVSIGKGNFDYEYNPIGEKDILGKALVEMRNKLMIGNQELKRQKDIAEESSALKSQFLKNMSHEIRTPLNGIVGFSELISTENLSKETNKEYSNIIVSCSRQLLKIIDDILEISGFETHKIHTIISEVNINELISKIKEFYYISAKEKNISIILSANLPDNKCNINTDERRLYKILDNFTHNAVKFSEKGTIEIGYITSKNLIKFYVKDQGIGINKENINKIFERFSQADENIALKYGGLGLGLAIALENANIIGGKIYVESKINEGSVFTLTLPYEQTVSEIVIKDFKQRKTKILIAEDEEINYMYLQTVIQNLNNKIEILIAENGKQAVEIFEKNKDTDIILMDIKMPVMDGYKATEIIRKINSKIPIIAQTAFTAKEEKDKCFELGFNDFVSKPISQEKIKYLLNKYLQI